MIELQELEEVEEEAEASDYEEDAFEEALPSKEYTEPVALAEVKEHFTELEAILQVKRIKKGDTLKYILHGVRDPETSKKIKKVTLETLERQFADRIGFTREVAGKLSKFLIEVPNEEGKIL